MSWGLTSQMTADDELHFNGERVFERRKITVIMTGTH
jgi:hypothetical protein